MESYRIQYYLGPNLAQFAFNADSDEAAKKEYEKFKKEVAAGRKSCSKLDGLYRVVQEEFTP